MSSSSSVLVLAGLALGAAGFIAFVRTDCTRSDKELWVPDLIQLVFALAAGLTFLALGFALDDPYLHKVALGIASVEAFAVWSLWGDRPSRDPEREMIAPAGLDPGH
jgi:hypothetical protein